MGNNIIILTNGGLTVAYCFLSSALDANEASILSALSPILYIKVLTWNSSDFIASSEASRNWSN